MPENSNPHPEKEASSLTQLIAERIQQEGSISVADYMALALGHPTLGYYTARNPFGAEGDFITAPEISQMFGEMIGSWLVDAWLQMGRPESVKLVELGPGKGTLMADILRTISAWPDFKAAVTVHLVETSPVLRDIQAKALHGYRVGWYDDFSEVPEGICFVIANEFFDALPIHQFEKSQDEWKERRIGYHPEKGAFAFTTAPIEFSLQGLMPEEFLQASPGNIFEVSPVSLSIIEEISGRISRSGGAALIIDYGHSVAGLGDTLQAVSRHQYADVLEKPGERDITVHVDFATLKTVAEQAVSVTGPVTQGQFLIAMGIEARAQKLGEHATDKQRQDIMTALCRLVAPKEMGRLFKVMALTSKADMINPAGFNTVDAGDRDDEISDN